MIMIDSMAMPMMYVSHVNGEPRTSGSVGKSGDTEKHQFPAKRYLHMTIPIHPN
jgi:hypothetical protein